MDKDRRLVLAICFLGLSILGGCVFLGFSVRSTVTDLEYRALAARAAAAGERSEDMLTMSQAASFLGIDEIRLRNLMESAKYVDGKGIPYFKVDSEIWFSKAALADWIKRSADNRFEYSID